MNSILQLGMPGGPELLIILFVLGIPTFLWIWALVDIVKSEFTDSTNKTIWVLVIIFLPVIGSLLYLLIGRGQRVST